MGWCDDSGKHEGWVRPVFTDGRVGSGTSTGAGWYVQPTPGEPGWTRDGEWAGEVRPNEDVAFLQMVCECGAWEGQRVPVADLPTDAYDARWGELTEEGESLPHFLPAWRTHIAPDNALTRLADLADEARTLDARIAESVGLARQAGASWSAIGREIGLTKQGAQQRYGG